MKFSIAILCLMIPAFQIMAQTTGFITDARDGHIYKTVKIDKQWWMAENINIGTRINSADTMKNNGIIEKYVYHDTEAYADTFGGRYQWNEAMQYDTTAGVQGICPAGWHIPTDAEWKTLEMALGLTQQQADTNGWRGTDQGTQLIAGGSSGFNALGLLSFWSSSQYQYNVTKAWARQIGDGTGIYAGVLRLSTDKTRGYCVRCVSNTSIGIFYRPTTPQNINHNNFVYKELYTVLGQKVQAGTVRSGVYLVKDVTGLVVKKVLVIK